MTAGDVPDEINISIHALVKRATTLTVTGAAIADISIHALVKRATLLCGRRRIYYVDFNPRPRKEGDSSLRNGGRSGCYFNPRPRKEGDSEALQIFFKLAISIHALVKRATFCAKIFANF